MQRVTRWSHASFLVLAAATLLVLSLAAGLPHAAAYQPYYQICATPLSDGHLTVDGTSYYLSYSDGYNDNYVCTQQFVWGVGSTHTIIAPSPADSSGYSNKFDNWVFNSWSDGGAQSHTITAGSTYVYAARYKSPSGTVVPNVKLNAIYMTGGSTGWAVGSGGAIVQGTGTNTWNLISSPTACDLYAVNFGRTGNPPASPYSSSDGWIVGGGGSCSGQVALHWNGASWGVYTGGLSTGSGYLRAVSMSGSTGGSIIWGGGTDGSKGAIYAWNGVPGLGGGWSRSYTGSSGCVVNGVWADSSTEAWAVDSCAHILHFFGGGWTSYATVSNALNSIHVWTGSGTIGWASGSSGSLYQYNTGYWSGPVSPGFTALNLPSVSCGSTSQCYTVANGNTGSTWPMFVAWSGGAWTSQYYALNSCPLNGVFAQSTSNVWFVGDHGTVARYDGTNFYAIAYSGSTYVCPQPVSITVTSSPTSSGYVSVDGSPVATPQTYSWMPGDTHTIAASSPVSCGAGCQYVWSSWSDSGAQSHTIIVPSSPATYTAYFTQQYYLTVTSAYDSPTGQAWYNAGASASSSVSSPVSCGTGCQRVVTSWTGTGSAPAGGPGASTGSFAMNAASSITWNWKTQYQLTTASSPVGGGTEAPASGNWYDSGSTVTLAATPSTNYAFSGWSGSGSGSYTGNNNPCSNCVTMSGPVTETANFNAQVTMTVSYAIIGGGTPAAPTFNYISGGVGQTYTLITTGTGINVDSSSAWFVIPNPLGGSGASERWYSGGALSGTASATTRVFIFYHQYLQTLSYSVVGGGTGYSAPTFTANQFGASVPQTLTTTATGYWYDASSSWSVTNPLSGSTSFERWYISSTASGTISSSQTLAFSYQHQYYLAMAASPSTAGVVSPSSGWQNSGASVSISASPSSGYEFSSWTCSGSGCYSGSSPSTSITTNAAIAETANFMTSLAAGTSTPSSPVIDSGQSVTLSASWSGGASIFTVKWYSGSSSTCSSDTMLVATHSSLSSSPDTQSVSPTSSAYYCAVVTDSASSTVTDAAIQVTVNPVLVAGAITPANPTLDNGQSITLTANPSGGTTPYSYQWYTQLSCTSAIPGATSSTYSAFPTSTTTYSYKVTDSSYSPASVCSAGDTVTVNSALAAPTVSASPSSIMAGRSSSLSSTAVTTGTSPYSYQWLQKGPSDSAYSAISGPTSATFTFSTTSGTQLGTWSFELQVTDSAQSPETVPSNAVSVNVTPATVSATITSNPTGSGFVSVDGSPITTPQIYNWTIGDTHTIAAQSPASCGSGCQYVWQSWSDSSAQSHTITVPSAATTYTSTFQQEFQLTMQVNPSGSGSTQPSDKVWRNAQASVQISASPSAGFQFTSWSGTGQGNYSGSSSSATVTMNGSITETANFQSIPSVTVTVSYSVAGGGAPQAPVLNYVKGGVSGTYTITQTPAAVVVDQGSSWSVTPNPLTGSTSTERWYSGQALNDTATSSATLSFTFQNQYFVSVSFAVSGGGSGYSAPSFTGISNGAQFSAVCSQTAYAYWLDAGSAWSVNPNPLTGSASSERWFSSLELNGTVASANPVVATYHHQYLLMVSVTPAASATATPNGTTWQDAATTIMIQAFPVRGAFSSWSGTGSGSYTGPANPASVTMNAAVNETAIIADMVQVTIETSLDPSSSTVKIDGSLVQTPYSSTWLVGETHTVSATSSVSCGSGCQYAWQLWSDQGVQSHQVTAGGSNINLTAAYVREYSLSVSQSQGGSTNPVSGTSWFISSDVASVSATAQPGYVFTGWLVDGRNAGGSSPLLLTMDAPHTVVPQFLSLRAPLCVYVVTDPASLLPAPSVTPSGCPLLPGAQVTVTAQAIPNWDFLEFTATNTTFSAYQNSITFTMPPASVSVVAHYKYSGPNAPGIAVPAANMPLVTLLSVIALLVLALKTRRLRKHLN